MQQVPVPAPTPADAGTRLAVRREPPSWHGVLEHAPLVVAIAAIVWRLRTFLAVHTLPARGDPSLPFRGSDLTPQWAPWLRVAVDAVWHHGTLAFWDRFTNSGAPEFESPQAGVLSLTTFLGGIAPLEAAVKWSMLAHVIAGALGVYVLARRLRTGAPFAAIGALAFGLGTYLLDHFHVGHLDHVYAMGVTPWALVFLWTALERPVSWWRPACAAGIALGVETLEGATSALIYSLIACSLVAVAGLGRGATRWIVRVAQVGIVAGACFLATASPQLLPMRTYIDVTGRGGGLTLAQSAVAVREVAHPFPTATAAILTACGVVGLWVRRQRRAAVWLAAVVAVAIVAATSESMYAFLWRYVPGIRYQRIPQRALILVGIAGPVLTAIGAEAIWTWSGRWRRAGHAAAGLLLAWFVFEAWSIAPGVPPMADPRVEQTRNQAMRWVADHAGGTRTHIWEAPTRHWLPDNITVPLGLETINSYTPTEHGDYLPGDFDPPGRRTFLGDAYAAPARFWGLLNVRYVVSEEPREDAGFTLAAQVEKCPVAVCQPAKSTGPYIYENGSWMPRAWMVRRAVALVGDREPVYDAALDVLHMAQFDPARLVVLQLQTSAAVPHVDQVFGVDTAVDGALRWRTGPADDALAESMRSGAEPLEPVSVRRNGPNRIEFTAPSDGWLVASEKLSLYPGWSASTRRTPVVLYRADGILTAMSVRAGDVIRATYEPPRFRVGLVLLLAMIVTLASVHVRSRRRAAADAAPDALSGPASVP